MKQFLQILLIFVLFTVSFSQSQNTFKKCFNVANSHTISGNQMTVTGVGDMCDCNANELKNVKQNIDRVIFENSVTSIGQQCFSQFSEVV